MKFLAAILICSISLPIMAQTTTNTFLGDLRYRAESNYFEGTTTETLQYHRIRARVGAKGTVSPVSAYELRFATGTGKQSTNQTLGAATPRGSNYGILLDRAVINWDLSSYTALSFGRMGLPFALVGDSDLLFDSDLNLDGALGRYQFQGDNISSSIFANTAFIDKTDSNAAAADVEARLNSVGVSLGSPINDEGGWKMTLTQHWFAGVKGHAAIDTANFKGNTNDGTLYTDDYKPFVIGAELKSMWLGKSFTVFAESAVNSAANSSEKTAVIVGGKFGRLKERTDWQLGLDYRELKKDATVGAFVDGDSLGGVTGGQSVRATAGYVVDKNFSLVASYYQGMIGIASGETSQKRNKMQLDVNAKF